MFSEQSGGGGGESQGLSKKDLEHREAKSFGTVGYDLWRCGIMPSREFVRGGR